MNRSWAGFFSKTIKSAVVIGSTLAMKAGLAAAQELQYAALQVAQMRPSNDTCAEGSCPDKNWVVGVELALLCLAILSCAYCTKYCCNSVPDLSTYSEEDQLWRDFAAAENFSDSDSSDDGKNEEEMIEITDSYEPPLEVNVVRPGSSPLSLNG